VDARETFSRPSPGTAELDVGRFPRDAASQLDILIKLGHVIGPAFG
jgi:hypothetical protein